MSARWSFCRFGFISLQNSTCELNSSCGGKDPLWSPSSLCGMATPPSSRGMSPNLELSHSASHLPSRFHCTSGQRFKRSHSISTHLSGARKCLFTPWISSFPLTVDCFDSNRRERNACLQHSSHLFPTSHPVRWLPHNLLTSQHSPVQSTKKGTLAPLHCVCLKHNNGHLSN